jgi:hypothetical protein
MVVSVEENHKGVTPFFKRDRTTLNATAMASIDPNVDIFLSSRSLERFN